MRGRDEFEVIANEAIRIQNVDEEANGQVQIVHCCPLVLPEE
jgi:hypothetical protein